MATVAIYFDSVYFYAIINCFSEERCGPNTYSALTYLAIIGAFYFIMEASAIVTKCILILFDKMGK